MTNVKDMRLCVIGLGYVGLPLAHAFAKQGFDVTGFDINEERIRTLEQGHDWTNELTKEQLADVTMAYSHDPACMKECDIIIVAIPTPIDDHKQPDLRPVEMASKTIGQNIKKGAIVIYESTVYPGVTEEMCGPIIEGESGLKSGEDFFLGYSPERINPGDKKHTIDKIVKVAAGQDPKTTDVIDKLYSSIITAGVHIAPSIKVAELAKAIENAQRDLNIAFVNEIAMMCGHLNIRTTDVLAAAGTKWNFLNFRPGLVGGHCIGVDPYYLVEKATQLGMKTHVITAGRAVNDHMGQYVANQILKSLPVAPKDAKVLVMGLTFKENIPDTRNSKSGDVIHALEDAGCDVVVDDPQAGEHDFNEMIRGTLHDGPFDAIALLVAHDEYAHMDIKEYQEALKDNGVFYDVKSLFRHDDWAGYTYLSL